MSAPAPGPAPTNPASTPSFQIQQAPQVLPNGFALEADGSATRTFRAGDKNLKITVYFPQNCTAAQRNLRLQNLTDANLGLLGAEAVKLGLGTQGKGTKGIVNAIGFKQNEAGQLVEASKYFSNLRQPKVITAAHYDAKLQALSDPKTRKDQDKKRRLEDKQQIFIDVQTVWTRIRVAANPLPGPAPAPATRPTGTPPPPPPVTRPSETPAAPPPPEARPFGTPGGTKPLETQARPKNPFEDSFDDDLFGKS